MNREELIILFNDICSNTVGIESLVSGETKPAIFGRILDIPKTPLSKVQLNQILLLSNCNYISDDFYEYYWGGIPENHFYNAKVIKWSDKIDFNGKKIHSIEQFHFGLERLFIDSLFCFGNINQGFQLLCQKTKSELFEYFSCHSFPDTIGIRGNTLHFESIPKEDRYLISEMACKTYGDSALSKSALLDHLLKRYQEEADKGNKVIKIRSLLEQGTGSNDSTMQLNIFSATDILDDDAVSIEDIKKKYEKIASRFVQAREKACKNTDLYLSLVGDLDVYVATSMRTKADFMKMGSKCDAIFKDDLIKTMELRYFDPTISAADCHEDKGLIECLMVKCSKVLIYIAGERESFGKDVEAAMALSQGKPVIFLCENMDKSKFYKDVHPLARLINFNTGVANGIIVCSNESEVIKILYKIFTNKMEYTISKKEDDNQYYILKETITDSIIRIQTSNKLLNSAFWKFYKH